MREPSKPYYVVLTGAKNNAGDFLIKKRALELFRQLRGDRDVVDFDAWKPLHKQGLDVVNNSLALILLGGPSIQKNMYPGVYALVDDLKAISTKITAMGVGWKSAEGNWKNTRQFAFTESSRSLMRRIAQDGMAVSVRDYHTLNVLAGSDIKNVVMTGCPATYVLDKVSSPLIVHSHIRKVGFSLGVSFLVSKAMETQMKNTIRRARDYFSVEQFNVLFHHGTTKAYLSSPSSSEKHLVGTLKFIDWLKEEGVSYIDISGSAEKMISYYEDCDFHLGYRVHAHILMSSLAKPSLLLAEDGRGKSLREVFGGLIFDGFDSVNNSIFGKIARKLGLMETYDVYSHLDEEVVGHIDYEIKNGYPRCEGSRRVIGSNFDKMKSFILDLP